MRLEHETLGLGLTDSPLLPRHAGITTLILPRKVWGEVVEHLKSALPNEGVGLFAASSHAPQAIVRTFYRGSNADHSPTRYTMDAVDVRNALWQMQQRDERLVAVVHSHPRTPPVPSAGDLAEATLPGVLSVIVAFEPDVAIRAWAWTFDAGGRAIGATSVPVELSSGMPEASHTRVSGIKAPRA